MGVLVPRWTTMNFPVVMSKVKVQDGAAADIPALANSINGGDVSASQIAKVVTQIQDEQSLTAYKVTTLQDTLDDLLPGLALLLLMFIVLWLLRKRVSAITIIFGLFIVGILAYAFGIMA